MHECTRTRTHMRACHLEKLTVLLSESRQFGHHRVHIDLFGATASSELRIDACKNLDLRTEMAATYISRKPWQRHGMQP
jgi:hypothetical protein